MFSKRLFDDFWDLFILPCTLEPPLPSGTAVTRCNITDIWSILELCINQESITIGVSEIDTACSLVAIIRFVIVLFLFYVVWDLMLGIQYIMHVYPIQNDIPGVD